MPAVRIGTKISSFSHKVQSTQDRIAASIAKKANAMPDNIKKE
jgi:hypothetical protein